MSTSRVQMRIKVELRRKRNWLNRLRRRTRYAHGGHLPPPSQDGDTIRITLPRDRRLPGEPWDDYIARITQSNT